MKYLNTQQGFTLIELLVVVLIIGILASVAIPQYQKAVAKSRFSRLWVSAQAIKEAQSIYFLQHNQYANALSDLDITVPYYVCTLDGQNGFHCGLSNPLVVLSVQYVGKTWCCAYPEDQYAGENVCQSVTGMNNWSNGCNSDRVCHCYKI